MSNIDELAAKVHRLNAELQQARAEWHAALIAAHHIKVGNIVVSPAGPRRVQVTRIAVSDGPYHRIRYWGRKVLKSGCLHACENELWWVDDRNVKIEHRTEVAG